MQVLTTTAGGLVTGRNAPVSAAAEGRILNVRHYRSTSPPAPYADDYYGLTFEFSCEVTARFDHLRTASEKLRAAAGSRISNTFEKPERSTRFAAGEVIGHTDGNPPAPASEPRTFAFDYALYNATHENSFVNLDRYRQNRHLHLSLRAVCGGEYYSGSLRAQFNTALGYGNVSAGGDCRSASRDVAGALAGSWFRSGSAADVDGWRLAIATEVEGAVRLAIHPFSAFFFTPVRTTGVVNIDPALARGTTPYCYTDNATEFWFQLSSDGLRLSMLQRAGRCLGPAPTTYMVQWER